MTTRPCETRAPSGAASRKARMWPAWISAKSVASSAFTTLLTLSGRVQQAPRDRLASDSPDQIHVTADHQEVAGARQSDVEHLPGTGLLAEAVDGQDDGGPLEALEAEHASVEQIVVLPVRRPVGVLALRLALHLHGVAAVCGQQCHGLRRPALVEQCVGRVVGGTDRLV